MAAQGESSRWRLAAPESSDSEPEQPRQDTATSGEEQYESTDDGNSPPPFPYSVTGTSTPTTSSRYQRITGPGPRSLGSPYRPSSYRGTPQISRTLSTTAPSLLAPSVFTPVPMNPAFSPIDLSNLWISPNSERAQNIDQFNPTCTRSF